MCSIADTEAISFQDLVRRLPHSTFLDLTTQTSAPDDAWEEEITGWDPRSTRDPSSSSSFWPHQSDATSRLGPDLMPPSRPMRTDDEMSVQELETTRVPVAHPSTSDTIPSDVPVTSLEPEDSVQTTSMRRILFKRPPNPLDRVEPPKRTRGDDDDHSALLSAYRHDLEKLSENLKDGKSVFSGTGMPDMLDSAWLAIKIQAGTPKSETLTEAQSVEPLQRDVDSLLVTISFSLDEETIQQICSNPDPETAFNVMVRRRRAEVKVSTLEQKRELVKAKDKEVSTFVKYSVVEAASRQGISPSALTKMRWVLTFKDDGSLKARLVVQGFTDQRLGKIPTSSPTASRQSRQIFLTLAASLGFQTHKGNVKCAFLLGDLDEQRVDDDDDDDNSELSQHNQFPTHSANQSQSYLESCNWSIISVYDC